MTFVHDDADFEDLLRIVAGARRLSLGVVEKDCWVTHTLWALHARGFEIWFKGGTSLSKGFWLIERFSEDLDLKVSPDASKAFPSSLAGRSPAGRARARRRSVVPRSLVGLEPDEAPSDAGAGERRAFSAGRP